MWIGWKDLFIKMLDNLMVLMLLVKRGREDRLMEEVIFSRKEIGGEKKGRKFVWKNDVGRNCEWLGKSL